MDKEEYQLKQREKEKVIARERRKREIKKFLKAGSAVLVLGAGVLGTVWYFSSRPSPPVSEIIARDGMHWHPSIEISILGKTQEIPANIGMGVVEKPIHTHAQDGVIHLEFSGLVTADDIRLARFFEIWGKRFNKDCIFDKCSGPDGQLKMFVNGKENSEFENYIMRDGDKIEIIFEEVSGSTVLPIKELIVKGTEFSFNPSNINVKAGERVKITFQNQGSAPHNLVIEGLGISAKTIGAGQTDTIEFTAPATGTYNFFCSIPGHRPAGMEGRLIIE